MVCFGQGQALGASGWEMPGILGPHHPNSSFKPNPFRGFVQVYWAPPLLQLPTSLEARLSTYVQDRHLLIHRWIQERGIPEDNNPNDFLPLAKLALPVEQEARELTHIFASYVVKYAEPEWASANLDEYKAKMAHLFQHAHTDKQT